MPGCAGRIGGIHEEGFSKTDRSNGRGGARPPARTALAVALALLLASGGAAAQAARDSDVDDTLPPDGSTTPESNPVHLDTIEVTGTRIRGGTVPSPVVTIDAARIEQEDFADLGEVVRSLPQNFSGGQGPGIAPGATGGGQGNQNITGGAGLNLRGLGQDATLTLLNGRRMSYGGFVQMVDISAIPVEAVERIEIVADGASAIYGSDAVGGVGNVILRRDFDGVALGARYGAATDGGLATREATATGGAAWQSGGLIATWKKSSNDPIRADQRDYTDGMYAPTTLYQEGDLRSGVLSGWQELGDVGELRLDALGSERSILTEMAYATNYERSTPETSASLLSPSVELYLPGGWTLELGSTFGRERTDGANAVVTPAAGTTTVTRTEYRNTSRSHELGVEGPVARAPGGDARLAAGVGYRYNDFETRYPDSGYTQASGDVRSRFAYAEVEVPLVAPDQGVAGAYRLALTGAVRSEDYDRFGDVTTPKLGVVWGPSRDVTVKASWGRSFKVPTLSQQYLQRDAILFPAIALGGTAYPPGATALYLVGGNPDLDPERARTWSASLAFHPAALPGFESEVTWFDVDYSDRVVQPLVPAQALSNPAFAEFLEPGPSAEELDALLRTFRFTNATGQPLDAATIAVVVPNLYVNSARQRVRGADVSGRYRFDLAEGALTLRGALTWLDSTRQVSSGQPELDMAGELFYPADLNARVGAVWNRSGFTGSLFGNYRSGVRNPVDGEDGASFTTFDATLRYDTGMHAGALSDVALELTVQNLLDRAPPLYAVASPTFAPYDSTNYSAIGRFAAVSVSKRW
ncbi:TonB-dependent receptor [Coralloluteibacterium stylophorae]|uniref:TonB-dependent receptor n=1 Tax=Coralloluteibacterium stylophorae TaxID=1776034 RepID=A0A8J8AYA6_9GAMM|nr:TonB-dependent receptor [Coralloluteibacterium stylophorae]